jgi:hypothetical protein
MRFFAEFERKKTSGFWRSRMKRTALFTFSRASLNTASLKQSLKNNEMMWHEHQMQVIQGILASIEYARRATTEGFLTAIAPQ